MYSTTSRMSLCSQYFHYYFTNVGVPLDALLVDSCRAAYTMSVRCPFIQSGHCLVTPCSSINTIERTLWSVFHALSPRSTVIFMVRQDASRISPPRSLIEPRFVGFSKICWCYCPATTPGSAPLIRYQTHALLTQHRQTGQCVSNYR